MADRVTKLLLAAIALGLWANVVGDWVRPSEARAQTDFQVRSVMESLRRIERDVDGLWQGTCPNRTLCPTR